MKKYLLIMTLVTFGQAHLEANAVIGFLFGDSLKTERQKTEKCIDAKAPEYKKLSTDQAAAKLAYIDCARSSNPHTKRGFFNNLITSYKTQLLNDIQECAKGKFEYYRTLPREYLQDLLALRSCTE